MITVKTNAGNLPPVKDVPCVSGADVESAYSAYLSDESRLTGSAEKIFFPEDTLQAASVVKWAQENGVPLTVSGGRTGVSAGAVPYGGAVLSCERLRTFGPVIESEGRSVLTAGAGVTIQDIADALRSRSVERLPDAALFYPPDPTEATAELGGTIACNASGARTFQYGPTRRHVHGITVVLPTGEILRLERGDAAFDETAEIAIETASGTTQLKLPDIPEIDVRKNAAGFYAKPGMDLVDLFIGSEGVLGVITEAQLYLSPEPAGRVAALLFTRDEAQALEAAKALREEAVRPEAIEFFDSGSLDLLHAKREEDGPGSEIPQFPYPSGGAIFTEIPFADKAEVDAILDALLALIDSAGIPEESTWVGTEPEEAARMKAFRHALPETVNSIIGRRKSVIPGIHKVGTDLAVPDGALDAFIEAHHRILEGFEHAIYGHIGDNHLHANMLPRDDAELERAKAAYMELVKTALSLGGTVSAEHGIGKLKVDYLRMMLSENVLAGMKRIKETLDPKEVLSPGNVFG